MNKSRTVLALLTGVLLSGGVYCHLSGMTLMSPVIPPEYITKDEIIQTWNEKNQKINELEGELKSSQDELEKTKILLWSAQDELQDSQILLWSLQDEVQNIISNGNNDKLKKLEKNVKELETEVKDKKEEIITLNGELAKVLEALSKTTKNYLTADKRSKVIFSYIIDKWCPEGERDTDSSNCPKIKKLRNKLGNIDEPTEKEIKDEINKIIDHA